jgi:hypothetical protein
VVLAGFPTLQLISFDVATESLRREVVGQPTRAVCDVGPREALVAKDKAFIVWTSGSDCFVDFSDA